MVAVEPPFTSMTVFHHPTLPHLTLEYRLSPLLCLDRPIWPQRCPTLSSRSVVSCSSAMPLFLCPPLKKREFLNSPGSGSDLFDQGLPEKVLGQVKEDSFISSSLSLAKLAHSQSSGRGKHASSSGTAGSSRAGPSGYSSPLDYPRSGSTSSGKHSASPNRGGGGKQSSGVSPSPKSKRGFRAVGVIFLSSPDQQLFVPPLAGLEGQERRSLGGRGPAGRLSDFLPVCSSSVLGAHPHAFVFPNVH